MDLTCVRFRAVNQEKKEMDQAARRARLLRPRIGTIQNGRGASLDRAVAHNRARRPWHHLRSATGIANSGRRQGGGSNTLSVPGI